jgi:peptidoglycan/xylan/chitin deacetylase (PgdA/CDA1 family)
VSALVTLLLHDVYGDSPAESGFPGPAAARYKLRREQFEAQLAGLASLAGGPPVLLGTSPAFPGGSTRGLAITVDDGGLSYYTIVADRLEALGWRGHCLVTTSCIGRPGFLDARQLRELHARGHVIGSHSVSHPGRFSACSWADMLHEWRDSRCALADLLGEDVVVASVPGGYFSPRVAEAAGQAGLRVLFTSEPQTRIGRRAGCAVVGRFTIRPRHPRDFARRLAAGEIGARGREWLGWNLKKLLKTCLGEAYVRLARRRDTVGLLGGGSDQHGERNRSCV